MSSRPARSRDFRLAMVAMLQIVLLISSLAILPGTAVAEYAPVQGQASAEQKIRLFPKSVSLYPGGKAIVSAWTCPADDRSPFGKDRSPGTSDDDCQAIRADWSVRNPARAYLSNSVGYKTRVTLDKPSETKLIARWNGLERRAKVRVKDAPAKVRPQATAVKKQRSAKATPKPAAPDASSKQAPSSTSSKASEDVTPDASPASTESADSPTPSSTAQAQPAEATEPPAEPTEPPAEPTEPPAQPSEAPTESTAEPTTTLAETPAEPSQAPTEPTAAPAEPTAAPAEPTAAPAEPTAEPAEPTAAPAAAETTPSSGPEALIEPQIIGDSQLQSQRVVIPTASVSGGSTQFRLSDPCSTVPAAFYVGDDICVRAVVNVGGGSTTTYRVQVYRPSGGLAVDTPFTNSRGVHEHDVFTTLTEPGTWRAFICKTNNAGPCSPGNEVGLSSILVESPPAGSLTVVKSAVGGDDTFSFTSTTLSPSAFDIVTSGGSGQQVFSNLTAGTYDVSESVPSGWQLASATCSDGSDPSSIALSAGETVTCTFTNEQLDGTLLVRKLVVNDNGGTAMAGSFAFSVSPDPNGEGLLPFAQGNVPGDEGNPLSGQNAITVPPGTYTVTEVVVAAGYTESYSNCSNVQVGAGETEVCTITNDDDPASLTIVKEVTNDDGGTATVTDFGISTDAGALAFTSDGASPTTTYTADTLTVDAGTYSLAEDDLDGYSEGDWVCDNGDGGAFDAGSVTLANGDDVTCTIANDDIADATGTITVVKDATPEGSQSFGFSGDLGAFSLVDDGSPTGTQTFGDLPAGTYDITESVVAGWALSDITITGDDGNSSSSLAGRTATIELDAGEDITVTFTNLQNGSITVIKDAQPNGPQSFAFTASGSGVAGFSLVDDGTAANTQSFTDLALGNYTITETVPAGWDLTGLECTGGGGDTTTDLGSATAEIVLDAGEDVICTFTNTAQPASLTIVKEVTNDDGGTATVTDFGISTDAGALAFTSDGASPTTTYTADTLTVDAGTYSLAEDDLDGYSEGDWVCDNGDGGAFDAGSVTLANGDDVTCTITNDDIADATIIVAKSTDPAGGSGFEFTGDASGTINDGETIIVTGLAAGTYTATEIVPAGYELSEINCDDSDSSGDLPSATATFELADNETVTCTFTNTELATIEIAKSSDPAGGTGFGFTATPPFGDPADFTLDDGGSQSFGSLPPDVAYVFSETVPAGWALTDISCEGTDGAVVDLDTDSVAVTPLPGEDVTCTFTNVELGTIVIQKDTLGGDDTFAFTSAPALPGTSAGAFDLTTAGNTVQRTFSDLDPGIWGIQELDPPAGWAFTDLVCSDEEDVSGSSVVSGNAAAVDLQPGETVTCTFTNTELATIEIAKSSDPAGGTGFGFTATPPFGDPADFTLDDGGSQSFGSLPPDVAYVFSETVPAGWALTDISCEGTDGAVVDLDTDSVAVTPLPGEDVTCTFTNWELSVIVVEKATDPSPDPTGTSFGFTTDAGAPFSLGDGESQPLTSLAAGTYSVSETVPAGWTLDSATCDNGDDPEAITLGPGEVVTCTFTNVADRGSITVAKVTDPSPDPTDTAFGFVGDVSGSIGDGESIVQTNVSPGTYAVTELVPSGWTLASISCDDDDSSGDLASATATIELSPGEDVSCTFTNVGGDVQMSVDKTADVTTLPSQGGNVTFTFGVTNTGDVAFAIESLEDDVFGPLDGDADCAVGTVLVPGATCQFEETFLVEPEGEVVPGEPIADHVNTFESCSILSSGPVGLNAIRLAAVQTCATVSATVGFTTLEVESATPKPSLAPTDMLPATDASGRGEGLSQLLSWSLFLLLTVGVMLGAAFTIRNGRREVS